MDSKKQTQKQKLVLKKAEEFLRKARRELVKVSKIQQALKSPVKFNQREARVKKVLKIRNRSREILEKLSKENGVPKKLVKGLENLAKRADHLKRENCRLQIAGHFGVLKPRQLNMFEEKSRNNLIETRKYFCLHKKTYYDSDACIATAHTGPKLIQNYHIHEHLNEFTMILSGNITIKGRIGKKLKTLHAEEGDITFAKRLTVHTLQNNTEKTAFNATVKLPIGFQDRSNVDVLPEKHEGEIRIIRLKKKKKKWGESRHKTIRESGAIYKIGFLTINPKKTLKMKNRRAMALYVVKGNVEAQSKQVKKKAKKDYLIFTQRSCSITNLSKKTSAKLYSVIQKK